MSKPQPLRKVRPMIDCSKDVKRTRQEFKDECDINKIIARHSKTGIISHIASGKPVYGDFASIGNYQDSMNTVLAAQEAFAALPASLRKRFDNDPSIFLDFVDDPRNASELVELGLAEPKQEIISDKKTSKKSSKGSTQVEPTGEPTPQE